MATLDWQARPVVPAVEDSLARVLLEVAVGFVNVPVERLDAAIDHTLATVGALAGAGRCYLFTYDWEAMTCTNTHEWCAPGVEPVQHLLQQYDVTGLSLFVGPHRRGEDVYRPDTADPGLTAAERAEWARQGITALLAVPLLIEGECVGFVGIDVVDGPREWSAQDRELLSILAELLANAEQRRTMERVREAAGQLAAANEQLTQFAAVVSHDLKAPLTSIQGLLGLLRSPRVDEGQREELLARAEAAAGRMADMIDRLLVYAGAGQEIGDPVRLSLERVVRLAIDHLEGLLQPRGARVVVGRLPEVLGDEVRLIEVVQNLLANAVLHAGEDRPVTVTIQGHRSADTVTLTVADDGPGIPAEQRLALQRALKRAEPDTGPSGGLGLRLCARIVAAHGGTLHLGDSSAGGLLVTIRLPAVPAER